MNYKKDAANISVNLGTQLINAALTLMAISAGFFTFILDKKSPTFTFYIFYGLTFVCFIVSIFFGGTGIDDIKQRGAKSDWETHPKNSANWFDYQSIALLAGIVCIAIIPFLGNPKKEETGMKSYIEILRQRDSVLTEKIKDISVNLKIVNAHRDTIIVIQKAQKILKRNRKYRGKPCPCQNIRTDKLKNAK